MKFQFPRFRKKDLVITIHGFGHKTEHEFDPLSEYLEEQGFEVWKFSYFNPDDLSDTNFEEWVTRCMTKAQQAVNEKRTIHLVGFSMGGVIAGYLASLFPVEDLLLAAPAFYPFDFNQLSKAARSKIMPSSSSSSGSMSTEQTKAFINVVSNYRDAILKVKCPILILHGTGDEVIQYKSSRKIFPQIPIENKSLIFLHGAHHRFLYDGAYQSVAFAIIRDFFRHDIKPQIYPDADLDEEKNDDHDESDKKK